MVMSPLSLALLIGLGAAVLTAGAEWLHHRRIRRIERLAFAPDGRAPAWTFIVPIARVVAIGCLGFGLTTLLVLQPQVIDVEPDAEASRHVLLCMDASPSMFVEDAGPSGRSEKRMIWAGEVIQGILDRIDTKTTRVTVFAIYTKTLPVIEETFDLNVVRNLLDGLPLHSAFPAGQTKFMDGMSEALDYARRWPSGSTAVVVVSDGDFETTPPIRSIPSSVADAIVIGVGDPVRPTTVSGHRSKQETHSLTTLASQLRGVYHQGNERHVPSSMLDSLSMISPRTSDIIGLREAGLVSTGFGALILALLTPLLTAFGYRRVRRTRNVRVSTSGTDLAGARG